MRRWLWPVLLVACGSSFEETRLAALPRIPANPVVPQFPPQLRGLTFRTVGRMDAAMDERTMARLPACVDNFEEWMSAAGWTPVRDPQAPVDFVIEEHCAARVTTTRHGDLVEMRHAESETVALVVAQNGVALVTVPRGPADYLCDVSDLRQCAERAEKWAQAHILETLIASEPLARAARQILEARAR